MNRREFLKASKAVGMVGAGALLTSTSVRADAAHALAVNVAISRNHGHDLALNTDEVIRQLRITLTDGPVSFNIQGRSGHPHSVSLNAKELLNLVVEGEVNTTSSTDAGHSHDVNITLAEV